MICLTLTCGRIQTMGLRRDNDFVFMLFVGKSLSSCRPPEPRDKMPLHERRLFGNVPFEIASIDRGRESVDKWSCPFSCVPPFDHGRIFKPPSVQKKNKQEKPKNKQQRES